LDAPDPIIDNDDLKIWSHASTKSNYIIGADTAQGLNGGDWCTASVIEVESQTEVAFYRGKLKPIKFAHKLSEIARLYSKGHKKPLIGVERNNHGHAVLQELEEHIQYSNLYYHKKDESGWLTTSLTRPIMMNEGLEAVESQIVKIKSKETFREMLTLINKNGKIQAAEGKHDDCVMGTFVAIQILLKNIHIIKTYQNINGAILV